MALTRRDFLVGSPPGCPAEADYWIRVHRRLMACRVEIVLPGEHGDRVPVARRALDYGDRLEDLMTIFRDTSELMRINRNAYDAPVATDPALFAILGRAAEINRHTHGAFDITSTPLSRCWGFLRREGRLPAKEEIEAARAGVGMRHVRLDPARQTVAFDHPRTELNLGSIGKGFAIDRMAGYLRGRGVRQALLSAGSSSVLGMGGAALPWPVHLWSATDGGRLATIHLAAGALGTSGAGEQFFEVDGVRYGHVIDPRTGWPAAGVLSASVIASDAATADALSTAFFIGGADLAARYCAGHSGVLALVTPDDDTRRPLMFGSYAGAAVALA